MEELEFIPPELIWLFHNFVKSYDYTDCDPKDFAKETVRFSNCTPYLSKLNRDTVTIAKAWPLFLILGFAIIAGACFVNQGFVIALIPVVLVAYYLTKLVRNSMTQQRVIILSIEALASDFAGWGSMFPKAREQAQAMLAKQDRISETQFLDLFTRLHRNDPRILEIFQPSTDGRAGYYIQNS